MPRLGFALGFAIACSSLTAPDLEGRWGGDGVGVILSRAGGTVSYACGEGTIDSTWTLTGDGRFSGTGQHFPGGGPLPGGGSTPHPARYVGQLAGNTLVFGATIPDLGQTLGPFRLTRGGSAVGPICLSVHASDTGSVP